MLKASAPQKRMRRGSWCFDVVLVLVLEFVLDQRIIAHLGIRDSTTTAGLACIGRRRRGGILGFDGRELLRVVEVRLVWGRAGL
jgi:hypothetical protein